MLSMRQSTPQASPLCNDNSLTEPVILAVGESRIQAEDVDGWQEGKVTHYVMIDRLDAELVRRLHPDLVVTALVSRQFDCLDVARILVAAEFQGAFRVLCPDLPRPDVVTRDLRAACPGLDVALLPVPVLLQRAAPPERPSGQSGSSPTR